jgi:GNAT superfamily N-acetyltransferase
VAGFHHLSPASRRHRFFSPVVRLTPAVAEDLTAVDDQHLVLLAFDAEGRLLGGARATRHRDDPSTADLAVTVGDDHQRKGLGTKLLRLLRTEAKRAGIERLAGHVLLDNAAGQALLVGAHAACWFDEPGVLAFEIPLGRRTVAPEIAARRTVRLAS